ncbi:ArsR/SmtB family transcription factor [Paraburkholderia sp. GAS42]|uniref:ArsR/SmtB family transcription factor n=1 Tax=Paraburkholderia sp. GAS42 TaxID=3035135 RepID=UPI003D1F54E4
MIQSDSALDGVFRALSDPTRRAMLRQLATGERNIRELAAPFDMSFAAASKHVKVLEGAGLIRRRIDGRSHVCQIEAGPLAAVDAWLRFYERFWTAHLGVLDGLLREASERDAGSQPSQPDGPEQKGEHE